MALKGPSREEYLRSAVEDLENSTRDFAKNLHTVRYFMRELMANNDAEHIDLYETLEKLEEQVLETIMAGSLGVMERFDNLLNSIPPSASYYRPSIYEEVGGLMVTLDTHKTKCLEEND